MDAPCAPMPRERLKLYAAAFLNSEPHARVPGGVALLSMGRLPVCVSEMTPPWMNLRSE